VTIVQAVYLHCCN